MRAGSYVEGKGDHESLPSAEQVRVTEAGAVEVRWRNVALAVAEAPVQLALPRTNDHVDT